MPDLYRTISGALFRAPNLEHNNRDHIPWNAVQERADRNVILVNGTKEFTLEQVYDKLFQKSYEEWLAKERKKSRAKDDPPTYYEKIQKDKKKHLSYEIIWQIGDMDDTGYGTDNLSAIWAEDVLLRFADHGIIAMWAKVHGIASIASMQGINKDFEWEDALDKILVE